MNIADEAKAIEARVWSEFHIEPRYDGANGATVMVFNSPGEGQKTVRLWLRERRWHGNWEPTGIDILIQRLEHSADDPQAQQPNTAHGQWAWRDDEKWPAIKEAMRWLSGVYESLDHESIGGEARA